MKDQERAAFAALIETSALLDDAIDKGEDTTELRAKLNRARTGVMTALADPTKEEAKEETTTTQSILPDVCLRNYVQAYASGQRVKGAEAEACQELGLDDNSQLPLEALLPVEQRADVVTTLKDTTKLPQNTGSILGRVFKATDAAFLGVSFPSVPAGTQAYPVLTAGTTATSGLKDGEAIESGAATVAISTVTPTRISARYVWRIEDTLRLSALESTLQNDMREVLSGSLDDAVTAAIRAALADPAAAFTGAPTREKVSKVFYDAIDGIYARTEGDLRALLGLDTYKVLGQTYSQRTDRTVLELLTGQGFTVQSSSRSPDAATNVQEGLIVAASEAPRALAPVWQGVTLIRDPYTGANKAEVSLTAHMLHGFHLVRSAGWRRVNFRLAA